MISQELYDKLQTYVQSCDCELYDIVMTKEFNQEILRIFIYSKEGITLDQCQKVSNLISPILDVEDPFNFPYLLEVSSPGIERTLTKPNHFKFSLGEKIQVKMIDKTILEGVLQECNEDSFVLLCGEQKQTIPYSQTKKVKTFFEW